MVDAAAATAGGAAAGGAAAGGAARGAATSPFRATIFQGYVALVTGGASGIGLEITRQLARHGARVVMMGRRADVLQQAVMALRGEHLVVHAVRGDVRVPDDAERALNETQREFGGLDILVNCAAGNFLAPAEDLSTKGFQTVIDIDAVGVFNMSRAAYTLLRKSRDPSIINISATLHCPATWYQVHASAAKAAIDSVTRSLALEWGEYGIRVNGVAPGPIAGTAGLTKLASALIPAAANATTTAPSKDRGALSHALGVPVGRLGTTADIALTCVYLCSSAASYVSGQTLVVDGAAMMFRPALASRQAVREVSRKIEKRSRQEGIAKVTIGAAAQRLPAKL